MPNVATIARAYRAAAEHARYLDQFSEGIHADWLANICERLAIADGERWEEELRTQLDAAPTATHRRAEVSRYA